MSRKTADGVCIRIVPLSMLLLGCTTLPLDVQRLCLTAQDECDIQLIKDSIVAVTESSISASTKSQSKKQP